MREKNKVKKNKNKKNRLRKSIYILIFLIGLGILLYPLISQYEYYLASKTTINSYYEESSKLANEDIEKRIALAHAYNDALFNKYAETIPDKLDPFQANLQEEGKKEYARMLEVNEQIGVVKIPKILVELPVYAGTVEKVLQKGCGHIEGTSLPVGGNNTHAVISAHRGLPTAKLFTDLDKLKVGDYFYFKNIKENMAYQVDEVKVIKPEEIEKLDIVPGHDYMTLITCTPYMVNSHRLLVRGHRVEYNEQVLEKQLNEYTSFNFYKILFFITLTILIILILYLILKNRKERKERRKNRQNFKNAELKDNIDDKGNH